MMYVTTRQLATRRRQYEVGDLIDLATLRDDEIADAVRTGGIIPTRFVGTSAELAGRNPIPGPGVPAVETNTGVVKFGDGVTAYNSLTSVAQRVAADAALTGTYARLPAFTVVLAGDSWTSQVDETDSVVSPPQQWWSIQGYWAHCQQSTRARWTVLNMGGLLGDTCAGLEARIPTAVLAYSPGIVVDLIGTNDVVNGATAASIIASDARRMAVYRAAGITVILGTIPPQNGNSTGKKSVIASVNASRRALARTTPGVYVWDVHSSLVDPATGEFRSDCQSDGTHPSVKGAAIIGQLLGRILNAIRSTPESDGTAGTATDTSQYLANPAMTGASAPPTGWSIFDISGTSVYTQSLVARTDDLGGQFWQLAVTSGSLLVYQTVTMATAGLVVGDPVYGIAEYETDEGATPTDFWMQIGHRDASTFYDYNYDFRTITSWSGASAYLPRRGLFRTRRQQIVAGSDRLEVGLRISGTLTVRLGRTALVKGEIGR